MYPIAVAMVAGLVAWEIYVLTVMWGWFIAPMFGLDTPSMTAMAGLYLFWSLLPKGHQVNSDKSETGTAWRRLAINVLRPAVVLMIGWVLA
jgi:hypothetical protein